MRQAWTTWLGRRGAEVRPGGEGVSRRTPSNRRRVRLCERLLVARTCQFSILFRHARLHPLMVENGAVPRQAALAIRRTFAFSVVLSQSHILIEWSNVKPPKATSKSRAFPAQESKVCVILNPFPASLTHRPRLQARSPSFLSKAVLLSMLRPDSSWCGYLLLLSA